MPRSIWNGSISFGLVNIPIKIYTATTSKSISFNNLCGNGHRLKQKRWCPVENREVSWEEVQKGYEISKGKYIVVGKDELENVKLNTTKTIDIVEFVDSHEIDPLYIEKSYYVMPETQGEKAYILLVESLNLTNKIAIGKVVLREKEYLVALRPYKNSILMHMLYYKNEVKDLDEFEEIKDLKIENLRKEELNLASVLIDKLTEDHIDMNEFEDTYEKALRELIQAKAEGREVVIEEERPEVEAKSLMDALKESIEKEGIA